MGIGLIRNQLRTPQRSSYTCDGNKNVSELVHFETRNGIAAQYAPFGVSSICPIVLVGVGECNWLTCFKRVVYRCGHLGIRVGKS